MKLTSCLQAGVLAVVLAGSGSPVAEASPLNLETSFRNPPPEARPWVYWFPLSGNLSSNGITADLEAMARVGIGGVLYMETDQGAPEGPARFAGPLWRDLFKHLCAEAQRLGLQVNMNNDAGWCGSGGPWITPELSMQKVTWSETNLSGPLRFEGQLAQPPTVANYYRDIAVYAFPSLAGEGAKADGGTTNYRISKIDGKAFFVPGKEFPAPANYPVVAKESVIPRDRLVDLTAKLGRDGRLEWEVPPGAWTIVRFGHTSTGKDNHPAPVSGRGLECDKLSREAAEAHFNALMGKLIADNQPLVGEHRTLVSTHIDSWEVGAQNWTPKFREEFRRLRGYDPLPFLPVYTGRVVESLEISERFLWDLRQTVNDLLLDNYAGHFRELAHRHGIRLSIEAYDANPCDDLTYAGRADEPMGEFWSWSPYHFAVSCTEMASAAHVYGRRILGAEAFTATQEEKWQGHPFAVKAYGDWAFCEGVNRFVFHRYALQPWAQPDRAPGMSMGPWGLHYERGQTWWEQSRAWHEYLARCQFLLREGLFVADICYLAPEKSPQRWQPPGRGRDAALGRPAYNFDGCPPEVLFTRMSVKDGKLVLPDGMSYRVLVLPESETMTPRLLRRIAELVKAGATVIGAPPKKSPSLSNYPQCDAEVAKLAQELWGKCDGKRTQEQRYGKGRVIWGRTPEAVLAAMGVKPDFTCQTPSAGLRYIHRTTGDTEIYFVSSKNPVSVEAVCAFRAPGKRPELWWPDSGRRERVAVYDQGEGTVRVPLRLEPAGSVFVVFRADQPIESHRITAVRRNGELVLDTGSRGQVQLAEAQALPAPTNNFTMAVWAKPEAEISLPRETNAGICLSARRNDALYPPPGHETGWDEGHAGAGISVGRNGVCVFEHGDHYFAPLLVCPALLTNWTHVAVVYRNGRPSLYLNGQLARQGLKSTWQVRSGVNVLHGRTIEPFRGALGRVAGFGQALDAREVARLVKTMPREAAPLPPALVEPPEAPVQLTRNAAGDLELLATEPGRYQLIPARGKAQQVEVVSVPAPATLAGPWEVTFDPKWGGPAQPVTFSALEDWSKRLEEGIRFYSGTARYRKAFEVEAALLGQGRSRVELDLGRVAVMAEVKLNGKDLGILWKPPFRVDVTGALKPGENLLEVKVVNLWINRQIGDEYLPEDSERNPNGTLKAWPKWLEEGKPSPTGRYTFTSWRLYKKGDALVESGLIGPVTLRRSVAVNVPKK